MSRAQAVRFSIIAILISTSSVLLWCVLPREVVPGLKTPEVLRRLNGLCRETAYDSITWLLESVGIAGAGIEFRHGVFLVATGIAVPWLIAAVFGRGRPKDLGLRRPNRLAWQIIGISYLVALPLVIWMALSPQFAPFYRPMADRIGLLSFIGYYAANMAAEHFLFHGFMLGVLHRDARWPSPPGWIVGGSSPIKGLLQRIGMAQPTEGARGVTGATRWLGLPDGCVGAILVSAFLFGVIHVGKDPREFLLSFPGGLGLAYLAFRTNSWLTPFILHALTAGTALLIMALFMWK